MPGSLLAVLDLLVLALYGASLFAFARAFVAARQEPTHATEMSLWAAFIAHTVALMCKAVAFGHLPVVGMFEAMSFIAWSAALCLLFLQSHLRSSSIGVFILPFVTLFAGLSWMLTAGRTDPSRLPEPMRGEAGVVLSAHMATALFSYSCFAVAFAAGAMSLLLHRELRHRRPGYFARRVPPLGALEKIITHAIGLGLVTLGAGIVLGAVGLRQTGAEHWADNPKIVTAALVWLAYAFTLFMAARGAWRGARAAWASVGNFVMVFVLYFIVNLLFTQLHGMV